LPLEDELTVLVLWLVASPEFFSLGVPNLFFCPSSFRPLPYDGGMNQVFQKARPFPPIRPTGECTDPSAVQTLQGINLNFYRVSESLVLRLDLPAGLFSISEEHLAGFSNLKDKHPLKAP